MKNKKKLRGLKVINILTDRNGTKNVEMNKERSQKTKSKENMVKEGCNKMYKGIHFQP